MSRWVAVCTKDYGATTFQFELEAPSYTSALLEAYKHLGSRLSDHSDGTAVVKLYDFSVGTTDTDKKFSH